MPIESLLNIPCNPMPMSRSAVGAFLVAFAVVVAGVPGASALVVPPPAPPENFSGEYDAENQTVALFWGHPSGNVEYLYNVYRNTELVNQTNDTEFSEQLNVEGDVAASIYYVTAVSHSTGHEGPPGGLFFVFEDSLCSPIIIGLEPTGDPPVGYSIDHACIEGIKRSVDRLISDGPISTIDLVDPEDLV